MVPLSQLRLRNVTSIFLLAWKSTSAQSPFNEIRWSIVRAWLLAISWHRVYVGRTGDSSSAHAQSPFKRIGQHLDPSPNAKGNSLGRRLREAGAPHAACTYEMLAIGPIFPEQATFMEHVPIRDKMAALERAAADELKSLGYAVLGTHPRKGAPDPELLLQVQFAIRDRFPPMKPVNGLQAPSETDAAHKIS